MLRTLFWNTLRDRFNNTLTTEIVLVPWMFMVTGTRLTAEELADALRTHHIDRLADQVQYPDPNFPELRVTRERAMLHLTFLHNQMIVALRDLIIYFDDPENRAIANFILGERIRDDPNCRRRRLRTYYRRVNIPAHNANQGELIFWTQTESVFEYIRFMADHR